MTGFVVQGHILICYNCECEWNMYVVYTDFKTYSSLLELDM